MVPLDLLLNNRGRGLDDSACNSLLCTLDEEEDGVDVMAEAEDTFGSRAGSGMAVLNAGDVIFRRLSFDDH